uniref:Uncharacterized protein n=1 Tax=Arundo donax TaxID=35708 RepID=A0A0A9H356_ARUDO
MRRLRSSFFPSYCHLLATSQVDRAH